MELTKKLNELPEGMKKIYLTCDVIVRDMIKNRGLPEEYSEYTVLELLKENSTKLKEGKYNEVNNSLKNIFKELF